MLYNGWEMLVLVSDLFFFLMRRRPPRSTRTTHSVPTRRASDLPRGARSRHRRQARRPGPGARRRRHLEGPDRPRELDGVEPDPAGAQHRRRDHRGRSEAHTSELQSLMRISYAVFCLKTKTSIPYTSLLSHTHSSPSPNII